MSGYRIEFSEDGGRTWLTLAASTGSAAVSYRDASVGPGERRHYRVRGISRHGNAGPPSGTASATTPHGIRGIEVTSAPALGGDTYPAGETVEVTVTLSAAAELFGASLGLALGDAVVDAACVAGADGRCRASPAVVFRHVVQADEVDTDGIGWAANAIGGSAFTLGDAAPMDLAHAAAGPFAEHRVDGRALTVSVSDAAAVEGGALAFALELSRAAGHEVGVTWSTADGTAVSVEDYVAVTGGTVTFAPGDVTATVTVATVQDALDEASETLEVVLEAASGGAEVDASADRATGTVADDDAAPEVVVSGVTVTEGEAAELALTLSGPSGRAVEVTWSTVDGTAVSGEDYEAVTSGEVMFAAGETTRTVVVQTLDDAAREGEESFVVRAQRQPYAGEDSPLAVEATVVIAADGDAMFPEGGLIALAVPTEEVWSADLTVEAHFDGQFSGFLSDDAGSLTDEEFSYAGEAYSVAGLQYVRGGSNFGPNALALLLDSRLPAGARANLVLRVGDRYHPLADAVYSVGRSFHSYAFSDVNPGWAAGDTVPVALLAYTTPGEPTELVATAQGARAVEQSWTAPEVDGGGVVGYRVEFSVDGGVSWRELAADTGSADTSYRDASVGLGERRHYRVRGISRHGNAGPPSEPASATALHGILGIEVTSAPALGGDTYLAGEAVEVTVTLSTAAELIGSPLGLALGDAVVDAACVEGVDGQCRASPAAVFRHVVQADEVDTDGIGWAADAIRGSAFVLGGVSRVDLTHAAAGPFAEHKVDGRALTVSVSGAVAVEGGALAFALELSRAVGHEVGVTWSTADGTAVSGADYEAVLSGEARFAAGETTRTVMVATLEDVLDEASETLEVVLEAVSGGAEVDASAGRATGTVADDDAAPEVVVSGVTVSEGEAAELALTLSGPSGRAVEVTWSTVDGTAVSGADYVAVSSGEVMFAAGETTHTVVVSTVDDAAREGEESFVVRAQRRPYAGEDLPAAVEATVVIDADGDSMFLGGGLDAPALPTEEVWSADLTVGTLANLYGYYVNTFGALTDTEFSLDASGYSVVRLYHGGDLTLGLDRTIPSEALDDLVVRLGGRHFLLSDAVYVRVATQVHHYVFSAVSPGWAAGETIPVALLAYTVPGEPTGLLATAQGTRAVDLVWTAPELDDGGIEGYRVEFSVDAGVSWRDLVADTGTADTSYRDASVGPGETRHYRVRGIGGHGNPGPPSGTASATTLHGVLGLEVTSAPAPGGDTYLAGEAVEVTVTLSGAAELLGASLGLALGDAVVDAACVTGADGRCRASPAVVFRHVVQADEVDTDGIGWAADALGGSAFTQGDASRMDLTHAAAGPFAEHKVDGRALTVSVSGAVAVEGGALAVCA